MLEVGCSPSHATAVPREPRDLRSDGRLDDLQDHDVTLSRRVDEALAALGRGGFDAALVDYDLDDEKGDRFVELGRLQSPTLPIIAVSARPEGNVALLNAGATHSSSKLKFTALPSLLAGLNPA